jgi:uncharacterized membrane protein YfcA
VIYLSFALALTIGLALGLIGGGGSILTVPVLVYVAGTDPELATAYSLFIVGVTALVGGVQNALLRQVDFKTAMIFGIPSIAMVYLTRAYILPAIPKELLTIGSFVLTKNIALMLLFSVLMVAASISMIRSGEKSKDEQAPAKPLNFGLVLLEGTLVGLLTGLVGAGGGFLIIPALVLLAQLPMRLAVGTSLMIIATKSLIGFLGDLQRPDLALDWGFLLLFTAFAVVGIFVGTALAKKIPAARLKSAFGWFVLAMGIYIFVKEVFFS